MAEYQDKVREILERRISLVAEISALHAEQLKNTQLLSGNQIDLQRCTRGLNEQGTPEALRKELEQTELREHQLQNKIAECNTKLSDLEQQVSALDRKLEKL